MDHDQDDVKPQAMKALQSDERGEETLSQHDWESTSLTELQHEALSHVLDDRDKASPPRLSFTEELAMMPPSLLSHTRLPTAPGAHRIAGWNLSLENSFMSEQDENRAEAVLPPLLTAHLVEDSVIPISAQAEIMQDPEPVWRVLVANRKCQLVVALLVFLISGLIAFVVVTFTDSSSPTPTIRTPEVQTPTPSMTWSPTTSPTSPYTFRPFLATVLPSSSLDKLAVEGSPQQRALAWVNSDDRNWTDVRRLQRWTLYVIYGSTTGAFWNSSQGWLSETSECSWEHVTCEGENVVGLSLYDNNLEGRVSEELALLTLLKDLNLTRNLMFGSLPSALSGLTNLVHL
jgi:hypothetical protein